MDRDKLLLRQVENFWNTEKNGLEDRVDRLASVEDRRAENILQKTTRMTEGHYETGPLWKNDNPQLPNNRTSAEARRSQSFRFLWWSSDADKPPDEYLMTVHVFGATDSPCCSNYSLQRTVEDNRGKYDPIVIDTVLRHFLLTTC